MRLIKKSNTQVYKKITALAPSITEKGETPKETFRVNFLGRLFIDRICQIQTLISIRICQLNKTPTRHFSSKRKDMDSYKLPNIDDSVLNGEDESPKKESSDNGKEGKQIVLPNLKRNIAELVPSKKPTKGFDFYEVRRLIHYVDKTMLIKEVLGLSEIDCNMICGPQRWGKSTNISMLYFFFAIHQKDPSPIVNVKDNPYKVLFDNTQIATYPEIFENHFGQYPVIYLLLGDVTATTRADMNAQLAEIVYDTISKYRYLLKDKKKRRKFTYGSHG